MLAASLSCGTSDTAARSAAADSGQGVPNIASDSGSAGDASVAAHGGSAGAQVSTSADAAAGTSPPHEPPVADTSDPPRQRCTTRVGSCPASGYDMWRPLLTAAELGPGARLLSTGGRAVLAILGDGTFRLAMLRDPSDTNTTAPAFTLIQPPATSLELTSVAHASFGQSVGPWLAVIACDAARTHCSIWENRSGTTWQERVLPPDFATAGVAYDPVLGAMCAYGNGLLCVDAGDKWQAAIPVARDLQINTVAMGGAWSLTAAAQGRWFARESDGVWQEQPRIGTASLKNASVSVTGGVISGEGRIQAVVGTDLVEMYRCSPAQDLVALVLPPTLPEYAFAVRSSGDIVQHVAGGAEPYCAVQHVDLPSSVIGVTSAPCGDAANPRILTAEALIGFDICVTVS